MFSEVGWYVKCRRKKLRMTRADVTRAMGYPKGSCLLAGLEASGTCSKEFWHTVQEVLQLDPQEVRQRLELDWSRFIAWLDAPRPYSITLHMGEHSGTTLDVPAEKAISPAVAQEHACEVAKAHGFRVSLTLSRRREVFVDKNGTPQYCLDWRPTMPDDPLELRKLLPWRYIG